MSDSPTPRFFPVLFQGPEVRSYPSTLPRRVAWALVEPLRARCHAMHAQTLEQLADRGGLSPVELYWHAHATSLRDSIQDGLKVPRADVLAWLLEWGAPPRVRGWACKEHQHGQTLGFVPDARLPGTRPSCGGVPMLRATAAYCGPDCGFNKRCVCALLPVVLAPLQNGDPR